MIPAQPPSSPGPGSLRPVAADAPSSTAERIADAILRALQPRSVLQLDGGGGAPLGAALGERGIARLEVVPAGDDPGSVRDGARFDVAICLGGPDGPTSGDPDRLPARLAAASDTIVFSAGRRRDAGASRSLMGWLQAFAALGFEPQVTFDLSPEVPDAVLLRRSRADVSEALLIAAVEIVRQRVRLDLLRGEAAARMAGPPGEAAPGRARGQARPVRELLQQQRTLEQRCADLETRLDERSSEATDLRKRLARQVREATALRLQTGSRRPAGEVAEIGRALSRPTILDRLRDPFASRAKKARRARRRVVAVLDRSGFVDQTWYVQRYPGVALGGMSACEHYVRAGAAELRDPSGLFSTRRYLAAYPDVASTGLNPLLHYLTIGQKEGREAFGSEPDRSLIAASEFFDADWYRTVYPDVAAAGIDPALHYLESGSREERDPGPRFSTRFYLETNPEVRPSGANPLLHFLEIGLPEGRDPTPRSSPSRGGSAWGADDRTAAGLVAGALPFCRPLRTYRGVQDRPRLTILTDSVNEGSLFGGVATAIILGTLLADRMGAALRVITRTNPVEPKNLANVLTAHGIDARPNVEFGLAPYEGPDPGFDFGPGDTLLTTSWWGTRAALGSIDPDRIVYLIQEDERMFYAHGDEHLACSETMRIPGLRYVVNSELLFRFFESEGLDELTRSACWFEPAFPASSYRWEDDAGPRDKHRFFFYARPRNHRNLFHRGLLVIEEALARGVLDPDRWEIHLAGNAIPKLTFAGGVEPVIHPLMEWNDYGDFIRSIDLGLSLMYTPHPSYPPLDIAASGGVALTNSFANKRDLSGYSENILCVPPDLETMLSGLRDAVALSLDPVRRRSNYDRMQVRRDWRATLEPVLARLAR